MIKNYVLWKPMKDKIVSDNDDKCVSLFTKIVFG